MKWSSIIVIDDVVNIVTETSFRRILNAISLAVRNIPLTKKSPVPFQRTRINFVQVFIVFNFHSHSYNDSFHSFLLSAGLILQKEKKPY